MPCERQLQFGALGDVTQLRSRWCTRTITTLMNGGCGPSEALIELPHGVPVLRRPTAEGMPGARRSPEHSSQAALAACRFPSCACRQTRCGNRRVATPGVSARPARSGVILAGHRELGVPEISCRPTPGLLR